MGLPVGSGAGAEGFGPWPRLSVAPAVCARPQVLQTNPQMQLVARQMVMQRMLALQMAQTAALQQQQQRPAYPASAAPRPAAVPKQRAPKQPKQPRQSKKAAAAAAAAAGAPGSGEVGGRLVWAKLSTYPWWPAKTLDPSDPSFPPDADPPRPTSIPIRFFGTYEFCWIGSKRALADWDQVGAAGRQAACPLLAHDGAGPAGAWG